MRRSTANRLRSRARAAATASVLLALSAIVEGAAAQPRSPAPDEDEAELAEEQQSRVTEVMNVGIQTNVSTGLGDENENRTLVRITALLPIQLSSDWRLIVFPLVPLRSLPPAGPGQERENGVGDLIVRHYLSPTLSLPGAPVAPKKWRWGIGPAVQLPTAANGAVGTGKVSVGPTAVLSYRGEVWTWSFTVEHLHSVGGVTSKDDVDLTVLFPTLSHTFRNAVTVGVTSEAFYDWRGPAGGRWLVPALATVSKVTDVGKVPVSMLFGAGPFVASPPGGPDWVVRFAMALLFPVRHPN